MDHKHLPITDAKQAFRKCGTCSQTFGFLLDQAFEHPSEVHERALSRLAGGIANHGEQCGMLWGATLAVGAEAVRREPDPDQAIGAALAASRYVVESFVGRTDTADCRDITGRNLDTVLGLIGLMFDTFKKGMDHSTCFELAEDWAPEAIAAARAGLAAAQAAPSTSTRIPRSCAAEVVRKMGGSAEEATMVAGFGGGLGLRGDGCGALGAAIWFKGLAWCREHPGEAPGPWTDTGDKKTLETFERMTRGEFECRQICGRGFSNVDDHTAFLDAGGCAELIDVLATS